MRVGFWNVYEQLSTNNLMFKTPDAPIGDSLLRPFNMLYAQAKSKGITCQTLDLVEDWSAMDAFVFMDMPSGPNELVEAAFHTGKPRHLILWENPIVKPDNWDPKSHALFTKVFTWNDDLVDNRRYFKINYAHLFPPRVGVPYVERRRLCTMIACNKASSHRQSLYGARANTIRWFEQNAPTDFDLYGIGWDRTLHPSWRGRILTKRPTLAAYKFSICFENAVGFPGYITEKIFDCFFAGCVPVYLGAPNVTDHIPAECFIDARRFDSLPELHRFMSTMSPEAYVGYIAAIEAYLKSEPAKEFSAQRFVDTMIDAFGG